MTNEVDDQYLNGLALLLGNGVYREGRNGGTYGLFGHQMRFDLSKGFPLLTTKKVHFKSIVVELLWFLRGDTNVQYLRDHGVSIWDDWADEMGELGPVYGAQWRKWGAVTLDPQHSDDGKIRGWNYAKDTIDQIGKLIEGLRRDPYGRRHIVTAWNPAEIDNMALPPCHCLFQFHVAEGRLSCQLYQRSADWFLGVPFNIASYALLTHLIAREIGLQVGDFIHTFGDLHLYANHVEQAREQIERDARDLPVLVFPGNGHTLDAWQGLFNLKPEDIRVEGYDPHPAIKAEVSK